MILKRFILVLAFGIALASTAHHAEASGFRGYLDEFCRTAEYIVLAECVEVSGAEGYAGARLRVETAFKAPETDPEPEFLDVKGLTSTATRFHFRPGRRYFAFVFEDGRCDAQGSHIEVTEDGRLAAGANELIYLEDNTDTLDGLTRQVKRVLSGEYGNELIARIGNPELDYGTRRTDAMALARTNPQAAVEPTADLLLEISRQHHVDGSSRQVYMQLLALDPNRAKEISLEILSNLDSSRLHFEAAEVLAQTHIEDFQRHYAMLVRAADQWHENNPGTAYAYMLPIFVNNNSRTDDVKRMLLIALSAPRVVYFDRVAQSAIRLQFPESLPLLWDQIKKERLVSELVILDAHIASHVGAARLHGHENYERLEVWKGRRLIRHSFPQYTNSLDEAEAIRVNKSLLFLITPDDGTAQACLYVGFVRNERGRFEHQVFVLFGE